MDNQFTDSFFYDIGHDIFSIIISFLTDIRFFLVSKTLSIHYSKQFGKYIRFSSVQDWFPLEYVIHGFEKKSIYVETESESESEIVKKIKKEGTSTPICSLVRSNLIHLSTYNVHDEIYDTSHLPLGIYELNIRSFFIKNLNTVIHPNTLKKLKIVNLIQCEELIGITKFTIGRIAFDKMIDFTKLKSLEYLEIGMFFRSRFIFSFPDNLKTLILVGDYNVPICLPKNLKVLKLPLKYDKELIFPESIEELYLEGDYKHSIGFLPNLRILRLGFWYKEKLSLPPSLRELKICEEFDCTDLILPDGLIKLVRKKYSYDKANKITNIPKGCFFHEATDSCKCEHCREVIL